ncbi:hypothetical protein COU61_01285 [Candidatus Pacearchaeota archaeon CG10_big_fil_rev_8_21_14_0_10_35_13]|nr:MAG: hypothetical protein COU61_01285 [Candidatus Pacearchaeota archaeon CG10_big_fil_rev_8_21_14_0_10_35_13]
MNLKNLGITGLLLLAGCGGSGVQEIRSPERTGTIKGINYEIKGLQEVTAELIPRGHSIGTLGGKYSSYAYLSLHGEDPEGKGRMLCITKDLGSNDGLIKLTLAAALLSSEENDGDKETVKVRGHYDNNTGILTMKSLTAEGYEIKLE